MFIKSLLFIVSTFAAFVSCAEYDVGDTLDPEYLGLEFSYCSPSDSVDSFFSFDKFPNRVFVLDISATW